MKSFPRILDVEGDLSGDCVRPGATKELHRVHRVPLTRRVTTPDPDSVLLDEAGLPILDEVTANFIYDTYPHNLV